MLRLPDLALAVVVGVAPAAAGAMQPRITSNPDSGSLVIHLLERKVGTERYELKREAQDWVLASTLDFTDRGSRVQLESRLQTGADLTPKSFHAKGKTYRFVNVDVDVDVLGAETRVRRVRDTSTVATPRLFFTTRGYSPLAARAMLIRYWETHARPKRIVNVAESADATIAIEYRGVDTVVVADRPVVLRRYSVDGVVWGREAVWLDEQNNLAAISTRVHILPLEAIRPELEHALGRLQTAAIRDRGADIATMTQEGRPIAAGTYALVGARVVDGTDRPPIDNAAVLIRDGRIAAVGARASVSIPAGTKVIDVRGKTLLPGLWDMHAHVSHIEWLPAYLTTGVTSVRDMGGELGFVSLLHEPLGAAGAPAPKVLVAGLIDGPGPNGFGRIIASTPEEGRSRVDEYHRLEFEQIKLYGSITAPVAGAVIRRAHELGMTVTGHIPAAMGLRAVIDSGMDNVAHMPFRGDESPNDLQEILQFLAGKHTVIDPTLAWNEVLGRAPSTDIATFEPGIAQLAPPLRFNYESVQNNIDSAGAAAARARGLAAFKALHDAGIPIVAGTDGGVPGYSLLRAIELAVAAGLTPLEAIQTATIVPARTMKMDKEVGTIETGKIADLVVLDANPLDNISNIRTTVSVVRAGRLYDTRTMSRLAGFVAQGTDAFSNVRCGSDVPKALIGGRMPNGRSAAIEAAHTAIALKDLGGSEITDYLFLGGWWMCGGEYELLVRRDEIADVVQLPAHSRREPAFLGSCTANGKRENNVLAVLDNPSPRAEGQPPYAPADTTTLAALSAWRVDSKSRRIVAMPTNGLRCPRGGIFTTDGGT